ncbi:hypothetical protein K443DRAFT_6782 [Laccaria amethystina LaAM-08-1]|uniref:G domain-containing protein n=1 Tax=Laccaria amethystina LaAM-08-1 TaxID=1095629 RepID=A0A0C9XVF6_9AGAR|nr:hypothetical protein K443DRAFT_6782 [Laccaria amethystina LaAM-08-1]
MSKSMWMPGDDIIILIMDPTGAGKSTGPPRDQFINYIAGKEVAEVGLTLGHDLIPCATQFCPKVIDSSQTLDGRGLVLVDTPGFDDTCVDNTAILHCVSLWLETMWVSQD